MWQLNVSRCGIGLITDVISESGKRHTPPPYVPAKMLLSMTAREWISVYMRPELMAAQFVPLSVERNTPLSVPAKMLLPLTLRDQTVVFAGRPELTAVQLAPVSVDRKIPL